MPPNVRYALLMSLLVLAGVVGIIIVVLLMGAWRRYLKRQLQQPQREKPDGEAADIWQISGQRLTHTKDDADE